MLESRRESHLRIIAFDYVKKHQSRTITGASEATVLKQKDLTVGALTEAY